MPSRKQVKLLIVNEHTDFCEEVVGTADMLSHEVEIFCRSAHNGDDAIACIKDWAPSVVLLDAHISGPNGFDILDRFRDGAVKIIVTSHYRSREIEESAMQHGAVGYVATSGNHDEIEGLLQSIASLTIENGGSH